MRVTLSARFTVSFVVAPNSKVPVPGSPRALSRGLLPGMRLYTSCLEFFPSFSKRAGAQAGPERKAVLEPLLGLG